MKANRARFPLAAMCRVLGLSTSGYYDWLRRRPSARARRDAELKGRILVKWIESSKIYGCPRIHAALRAEGERVSRKRVARLMRELGIEGVTRRRFKTGTTRRDAKAKPAPDLVNRNFSAAGPHQLWVADITYVPTTAGWLYLAVVLDTWSRRIVGWAMAPQMPADLYRRVSIPRRRRDRGRPLADRRHEPRRVDGRDQRVVAGPRDGRVRNDFPVLVPHLHGERKRIANGNILGADGRYQQHGWMEGSRFGRVVTTAERPRNRE